MASHRFPPFLKSRAAGFTLVEMAIVMAIVSVVVASALGAYKVQVAKQYRETTVERIKKIQDALATYRMRNDRIPCPASISAAPTSATFGAEYKTSATANCFNAAPPTSSGITTVQNTAATPVNTTGITTAKNIYIGAVPVKELGLPLEVAFDSWGRRFRYAVSSGLTSFDTTNHPFNPGNGVISVVDESNQPVGPVNGNPFFIISSGKDGAGGVTYEGKAAPAACPASSTRQGKNCSFANNQPFVYAQYAENSNATTRFDDYVAYDFGLASDSAKNIDGLDDGISDWPATGNSATNVFLGYNSGGTSDVPATASGTRNTGVGISSLQLNTSGTDNTAIGYRALVTQTTTSGNTAVGSRALSANTTGEYNAAFGFAALQNNTTGDYNTAVGQGAMDYNTTGGDNTAVGQQAMHSNQSGGSNTAVGMGAMSNSTTGSSNVAVGKSSMQTVAGTGNVAVGNLAMPLVAGGSRNVAIGSYAFSNMQNRNDMVAIGYAAHGGQAWGSDGTVAIGAYALSQNGGGSASNSQNNVAVGYRALQNNWGNNNSVLGYQAMRTNSSGGANTAFGTSVMEANTTGSDNAAFGKEALKSNTNGARNVAVGSRAALNGVQTGENVAVGYQALMNNGYNNLSGGFAGNVALGAHSMENLTYGGYNVAIGQNAMISLGNNSWNNVAVGSSALQSFNGSSGNNVAVGHRAAVATTTGAWNAVLGNDSFTSNIDGGFNTVIGHWALTSSQHANTNTVVGNGAMQSVNDGGSGNVAIGHVAMAGPSTGDPSNPSGGTYNTVVGDGTIAVGYGVAVGSIAAARAPFTVAIGSLYQSGSIWDNTTATGTGAVAIGSRADALATNAIAIGYGSQATGTGAIAIGAPSEPATGNNIVIGNKYQMGNAYIRASRVYFGPGPETSTTETACVTWGCLTGNSNGAYVYAHKYWSFSDERLKKDIKNLDLGLGFIEQLRPVSYTMKAEENGATNYGFIAQEVEKLVGKNTTLVQYDDTPNKFMSVSYTDLIAPVVKAVQELAAKVEKLVHDVADVVAQLNPLKKTVEAQQARIETLEKAGAAQSARIEALEKAIAGMQQGKAK